MNFNKGYGPLHSRPKGYRTVNKLNRSQHLPPVRSYDEARKLREAKEVFEQKLYAEQRQQQGD